VWRHGETLSGEQAEAVRELAACDLEAPFVCPGCYAVGGQACASDCIDAALERQREEQCKRDEAESRCPNCNAGPEESCEAWCDLYDGAGAP